MAVLRHQSDVRVVFRSHPERPEEEGHPPPNAYSDPGHPHHVSVDWGPEKGSDGQVLYSAELDLQPILCPQPLWPGHDRHRLHGVRKDAGVHSACHHVLPGTRKEVTFLQA